MLSAIALLPLLGFAASTIAAPTPLRPLARSVPDIKSVIRNPAPIDHSVAVEVDHKPLADVNLESVNLNTILTRAAPAIDRKIVDPVDVVGRAVPSIHRPITDPVNIVN